MSPTTAAARSQEPEARGTPTRVVHPLGRTLPLFGSAELVDRGDKRGGCEVLTKQWALIDNTDGELSSPSYPLASTPSILAPRRFLR